MKTKILKLREEGKSYHEICQLLNCSKSLINYYCAPSGKEKVINRFKQLKIDNPLIVKVSNFKNRLKVKTEGFQHSQTNVGGGRKIPYDSQLMNFSWQDVYQLIQNNPKCYLTGDSLDLNQARGISLDHIIPVSKGGTNSLENLGICTDIANRSKSDMSLDDYLIHCQKVLEKFGYKVSKTL